MQEQWIFYFNILFLISVYHSVLNFNFLWILFPLSPLLVKMYKLETSDRFKAAKIQLMRTKYFSFSSVRFYMSNFKHLG